MPGDLLHRFSANAVLRPVTLNPMPADDAAMLALLFC